jgi:ribose-phosphate pyrophosphokinase
VRDQDVYVLHSLHGEPRASVNDKLCRLLFFAGALKDAGASSVTALVPYLCYARKDKRTKPRDPVTTRYVAGLFESVGIDRVVTLDVHNVAAFQNAFRIQTENLELRPLLARDLVERFPEDPLAVLSPDPGGVHRAMLLADDLEALFERSVTRAFMAKARSEDRVSGGDIAGDLEGRTVVVVDDLIGTGHTLRLAAEGARARGAVAVHCAATHGLFVGFANEAIADPAIDSVTVGDAVPPFRLTDPRARAKLRVLDTANLLGDAIAALHVGGSVEALRHA